MRVTGLRTESERLLESIVETVLQQAAARGPEFELALLYCSVPRWFDAEVAAGMLASSSSATAPSDEILQYLRSLPFCKAHPTRDETWIFEEDFRANLVNRKEVTAHWKELQSRAEGIFNRRSEIKWREGEKGLSDPDVKNFAVERIYHLQYLDSRKALNVVRQICAERLALWITSAGRPEVAFCLDFLSSLDWPAASEVTEINALKSGMKALATYDDEKALKMLYDLAGIPELAPKQEGALRYWIGSTHLRNEGRLALALHQLEKALQLDSNNAVVHAEMAAVYYWPGLLWGRFDLAQQHARDAVVPDEVSGYLALARIAGLQEAYDEAIAWGQKAIKAEPTLFNGYLSLSETYVARGDLDNALDMIQKAVRLSPDIQYYALVRRGNAYREARCYQQALDEYRKAIAEDPDCIDAYLGWGELHARRGQTTEAEQLYRKALDLNPSGARVYASLAGLYRRAGKQNQVLAICQQAKDAGVESKELLFMLLDLYRTPDRISDLQRVQKQLVRLDAAEEYAQRCETGDLWLAKGQQRREKRWLKKAQNEYEKALAIDPYRAWAYMSMARLGVVRNDADTVLRQKNLIKERTPWAQTDMLVSLGTAYLKNFQYDEAERTLLEATEIAPHRIAGWQGLSDLYYRQGNLEGVVRTWSKLVEINPTLTYDSYMNVGSAYQSVADYARAREQYTQAKGLDSDAADAYLALADLDSRQSRFDDAIANYRLVESKASGRAPIIHLRIASLLRNQRSYDEAEKAVRTAILLNNEMSEGYIELARLGAVQGKQELIEEAKRRLTAVAADKLYDLNYAIGDEYLRSRDYEKAERAYRECKRSDPGRPGAFVGLGFLRLSQEQYRDAKKWFSRALKIDPRSVEAYSGLCQIYEIEKNLPAFVEAQNRILEFDPIERCNSCLAVATMHAAMGQLDEAEQHLRTAIGLSPWRAGAYADLGSLLRRRGKLDEAKEAYGEAKEVAAIRYLDLGSYYEQQGKRDDALEVYRVGLNYESAEQKPDLYIALALLESKVNNLEQAQKGYEEAIRLDPTRADTYIRLAQLLAQENRIDEALEVYRQMAKQPALAGPAHISIGKLLVVQHRYEEAAQSYRDAIATDPKKADAYLELAVLYLQQGKHEEVEQLVLKALEADPQNPEPHRLLAELRGRQHRLDEAISEYRKVLELQSGGIAVSDAFVRIGNLLLAQKRYAEAEREFQQAIHSDPTNAEAYYNLGTVFEQQNNVDRAVTLYRKVVEFQPTGVAASDAYVRIGNLLRAQKLYEEAGQEFQNAIQSNPTNPGAYYDLATVYEQQGNAKMALRNYIQATDLAPKYRDAYVGRGRIYAKRKDMKSVARMARQILEQELDPEEKYDAYLLIADVYKAANDAEQAAGSYRKALELYPKHPEAYLSLAQLLTDGDRIEEALEVLRQMARQPELARTAFISIGNLLAATKDYAEAAQSYRQAIEAEPKEASAYLGLAVLYQRQGKLDEMEGVIEQALIAVPNDPQVYRLQAQLREEQGRSDEAITLYRRVVELQPTNGASSEAYEQIGGLMFKKKRYGEAEDAFLRAAQIDPVNARIHYSLGSVYEEQDKMEPALVSYSRATELNPKYGDAYRALAHIYAKQGDTKGLEQMANQILQLDLTPTDQYEAHLLIAHAYQEAELYEWAIDHLNQAVSLNPERLEAYTALGLIFETQQRWEKARGVYEKIGQLSPESQPDVHFRLGQLFVLEENPEEAEKEFEQVKERIRESNDERIEWLRTAYLIIASIFRKHGKLEAMRNACEEVLSQLQSDSSPDQDALRHRGLAFLMLGQYQAAVDALRQALQSNEADARARLYLALALLTLNEVSEAQPQLKKAIEQTRYKEDFNVAIEEAETLATQIPEVPGAKDAVQTLREAANKAVTRVVTVA